MMRHYLCAVLLIVSGWAHAAVTSGKVIAVLDGDTVLVKRASGLLKIRLADIDAPEKAQPFGESSRRSLSEMVLGKQVNINSQAIDQYGRMVAHLEVSGLKVNAEQIRRGMAWEYSRFHSNRELLALQEEARQEPLGLWALTEPTPPWEWRKLHPHTPAENGSTVPPQEDNITPPADPRCGTKKRCSQMNSCEEAKYYLTHCHAKMIDGDGDGIPCEKLCQR